MEYLARTNPWPYDITITGARGPYFLTKEYGEMFDMACGIAVNNLGHNFGPIQKAVKRTVDKYAHINVYGEFNIKEQLKYSEALGERFSTLTMSNGVGENPKVWFCTSGTESNELAMKLAILSTKRAQGFIALKGGFHGRTLGSLSLTHKPEYRKPFKHMLTKDQTVWIEPGEQIPDALKDRSAFFMELIQGEAGVLQVDQEWAAYVSKWCKDNGVLLVIDEVQTGFGRTGTQFILDQYQDVYPSIVTLGKALGGGYPLGAVIADESIMNEISVEMPFAHLSTFGGNPISVAAGREMFKATSDPVFLATVREKGKIPHHVFRDCKYATVHGPGLMIGLKLNDDIEIDGVVQKIWKNGVFSGRVLYGSNTIRLYAPINSPSSDLTSAFLKVRAAVEDSVK